MVDVLAEKFASRPPMSFASASCFRAVRTPGMTIRGDNWPSCNRSMVSTVLLLATIGAVGHQRPRVRARQGRDRRRPLAHARVGEPQRPLAVQRHRGQRRHRRPGVARDVREQLWSEHLNLDCRGVDPLRVIKSSMRASLTARPPHHATAAAARGIPALGTNARTAQGTARRRLIRRTTARFSRLSRSDLRRQTPHCRARVRRTPPRWCAGCCSGHRWSQSPHVLARSPR